MSNVLKELDLRGTIDTVEVTIKVFSEDNEYHCYIYEPSDLPRGDQAAFALRNIEISPRNEGYIGHMTLQSLPNERSRITFFSASHEGEDDDSDDRFQEYCSKLLNYFVMGGFIQVYMNHNGEIGLRTPSNEAS